MPIPMCIRCGEVYPRTPCQCENEELTEKEIYERTRKATETTADRIEQRSTSLSDWRLYARQSIINVS